MKTIYINTMQKGDKFEGETFAIYEYRKAEDKNGNSYYDLLIGDKTGRLKAKIWSEVAKNISKGLIKEGNLISIDGKVDEFRGVLQITITRVSKVDDRVAEDFIEASSFDAKDMLNELKEEIKTVKDENIKSVLTDIITDKEIEKRFIYWPAAKVIHHDFRSGLLQHVLEMITIFKGISRFYPEIDSDILLSGIILHDIGKLEELDATGISINYTKEGTLIGHIVLGAELFDRFNKGRIDSDKALHIKHLILSHHGELQFGSPVVPSTTEAVMLTHIDNLSSKARTAQTVISNLSKDQEFSEYNRWLNNARLWRGGNKNISEDEDVFDDEDDSNNLDSAQMPLV